MQFDQLQRREFITLLGGTAAAWPVAARAQQRAMPVIGYLGSSSAAAITNELVAFRQGLSDGGFIEGRNVAIEYRFADLEHARLPALAENLVRRRVTVIAGVDSAAAALAAKAATTSIPIVFNIGGDPVRNGIVANLNRPGGNITGITFLTNELGPKRVNLLRELIPNAGLVAGLVNPTNPNAESDIEGLKSAAKTVGLTIAVLQASNEREIDAFFRTIVDRRVSGFLTVADPLLNARREQIAALAAFHKIPAIYHARRFPQAGGLMSYAPDILDLYRQSGVYTARALKGEKPEDLPVIQPTRFELVINLKAARGLDLTIPPTLLAIADEVIE